ncbi:hypothetical protein OE88DRAFT_1627825 [Heliocybe sulcata]|uniref:Dynactin subunit 4 n=1 Tax=Heliocybe sulcata TaxID=5364 RepID=A0A5C3N3E7_9AGAM|nr:hypothetical protein OE88DRAFT_1627825 [Heliocybe sulcata]
MTPTLQYHCPCYSSDPKPPPPDLPSSSSSFHALHTLFFCEECDAVRCNRCVMVEVSGYYCPNCLFEVPSASVRAEKNRCSCARNCFLCPNCRNTLSVVPSDPPETGDTRISTIPINAVGEPPFFLYCNHCRWDSAEVGITFDKPTGLAAQLQRFEDSAPEFLEFERLKEHFEPFLRASSSPSLLSHVHSHHIHMNPITAAASSALARDVPGVGKYTPLSRSRLGRGDRSSTAKDEIPEYKSRVEIGAVSGLGAHGESDVEFVKHLENMEEVAELEQRWMNSWANSTQASDLKPLRIPLLSKKTKRCPSCRHILIKPEQKAQSVRYKIKLVAANYLPDIRVALPKAPGPEPTKRLSTVKSAAAAAEPDKGPEIIMAGRTYPFQLAFTNPLYDPIQVRLSVQRQQTSADRRPPFAVSLPNATFPVAAFAEAWEYEDDEDMFGAEDEDMEDIDARGGRAGEGKSKAKTVGVLEKRANVTVIGGEVVISKEATGNVKFNMLVSYTYRSDDPAGEENEGAPSRTVGKPEMKTFSFSTVVDLGPVIAREETRMDVDA